LEGFIGVSSSVEGLQYSAALPVLGSSWHVLNSPKVHWRSNGLVTIAGSEAMVILDLGGWEFRYQSPPLTEEELSDIHRGIEEIKSGRARHFKTAREAIDWLNRERVK